jgi:hypothetical protein
LGLSVTGLFGLTDNGTIPQPPSPINQNNVNNLPNGQLTTSGVCSVTNAVGDQLPIDLAKGIKVIKGVNNVSIGESDLTTILITNAVPQPTAPNTKVGNGHMGNRKRGIMNADYRVSTETAKRYANVVRPDHL